MRRQRLGEILIAIGYLDKSSLDAALVEQERWGGLLGQILIHMRLVSEQQIVQALSHQLNCPMADLEAYDPRPEVLALVPADFALAHYVVPFELSNRFLDVAMFDPTNIETIDVLRIRTKLNIRPHLAGAKAIEYALARFYKRGPALLQMTRDIASEAAAMAAGGGVNEVDFDAIPRGRASMAGSIELQTPQERQRNNSVANYASQSSNNVRVTGTPPISVRVTGAPPISGRVTGAPPISGRVTATPPIANRATTPPPNKLDFSSANFDPSSSYNGFEQQVELSGIHAIPTPPPSAAVDELTRRVAHLEALLERDESVLRAMATIMVSRGVATREELVALTKQKKTK